MLLLYRNHSQLLATAWVLLAFLFPTTQLLGASFREDFEDADLPPPLSLDVDRQLCSPIVNGVGRGSVQVTDGSLLLESQSGDHTFATIFDQPPNSTVEIRTRLIDPPNVDSHIVIGVGDANAGLDCNPSYWASISNRGRVATGYFDGVSQQFSFADFVVSDTSQWFLMRAEFGAELLRFWAWEDGDAMPATPSFVLPTDALDDSRMNAYFVDWNGPNSGPAATAEIDYIEITTVPEPSAGTHLIPILFAMVCVARRRVLGHR